MTIAEQGTGLGMNARLTIIIVLGAVALSLPATAAAKVASHSSRIDQTARAPRTRPRTFTLVDASAGVVVRSAPRGPILGRLPATTPLGTPTWLWALTESRSHAWARVVLPWTPNGRTGWVWLHGHRTVRTHTWVQVDLSRRRLTLMHGTRIVHTFPAGIGAPDSPTPVGRFSVTDPIATGDPSGPFGWYAFGLSGHQPHLPPGWSGGDQLAIHGTNDPATIGAQASAGCVHVSAAALAILKRALRPGTPVIIHP